MSEILECCPSCLAREHWEVDRRGECGLRICQRCSLLFVSPRPTREETDAIYSREYFEGTSEFGNPEGYQAHAGGYLARARFLVDWLRSKTGMSGGRWLDVGCGPGYLVEAAALAGFEASGVDVSLDAVEAGIGRGLQLQHGAAEDLVRMVKPGVQVVSMLDTLFHVREPRQVLSAASELLSPGGILLAGPFDLGPGPSIAPGQSRRFDFEKLGVPEHLSFVNQRSMECVLPELGFTQLRFEPMVQSPGAVIKKHASFIPTWLLDVLRRILRAFPHLRMWLHRLAGRQVNRQAGYVIASRR